MENVLELKVVKEFIDACHQSWLKGWNERNGGNMSYRLKPEEAAALLPLLQPKSEWKSIGLSLSNIAGEYFIVTGSGKYYKNILREPENNLCIVKLDDKGENYQILWGLDNGGVPTSELPTHLLNHSIKKEKTNGRYRVIMHAHPANTVALTFLLPLEDKAFTHAIWEMITECPIVFPAGIGVVPWMVCGSTDIALATGEKIRQFDAVIWAHHGIFCCGEDLDSTFGLMDTIEKAAEIRIKVMSCGGAIHAITKEQIMALCGPFKVDIDGTMLDD
ncbi:MAG: rhamnulose-1-phosphate aldolase [Clostridia bacterium]|nr:rhamnulose-1-phosphate aldolase [Clostridia bacterium]